MNSDGTLALANIEVVGRNSLPMPDATVSPNCASAQQSVEPAATASPQSLRGFWALIVTQFQGAFSDNILKNLVVFMILGASPLVTNDFAREHKMGEQVTALFSLPFIRSLAAAIGDDRRQNF